MFPGDPEKNPVTGFGVPNKGRAGDEFAVALAEVNEKAGPVCVLNAKGEVLGEEAGCPNTKGEVLEEEAGCPNGKDEVLEEEAGCPKVKPVDADEVEPKVVLKVEGVDGVEEELNKVGDTGIEEVVEDELEGAELEGKEKPEPELKGLETMKEELEGAAVVAEKENPELALEGLEAVAVDPNCESPRLVWELPNVNVGADDVKELK